MLGLHGASLGLLPGKRFVVLLAIAAGLALFAPNSWQLEWRPTRKLAVVLASVLVAAVLVLERESPFLYFQF